MRKTQKPPTTGLKKSPNLNVPQKESAHLMDGSPKNSGTRKFLKYSTIICVTIAVSFVSKNSFDFNTSQCVIPMPRSAMKIFRKPEPCNWCKNVDKIAKISNITGQDFYEKYIEPSIPVVVTDATKNWLAMRTFDFMFFKKLYNEHSGATESETCQFFPYKTDFKSLEEALNMDIERAFLAENQKPWYIGWNNCKNKAGRILRQHYEEPYFIPNTSESLGSHWIFMGSPGYGAHMHVDFVFYPSWQAQIRGRKLWRLAPPPECFYVCDEMDVVVESGEVIVLDTNRWYHQTEVLQGEISITIGSEFD